jgi:hypothetical protein
LDACASQCRVVFITIMSKRLSGLRTNQRRPSSMTT